MSGSNQEIVKTSIMSQYFAIYENGEYVYRSNESEIDVLFALPGTKYIFVANQVRYANERVLGVNLFYLDVDRELRKVFRLINLELIDFKFQGDAYQAKIFCHGTNTVYSSDTGAKQLPEGLSKIVKLMSEASRFSSYEVYIKSIDSERENEQIRQENVRLKLEVEELKKQVFNLKDRS